MTSASSPAFLDTDTDPECFRSPIGKAVLCVARPRRTSGKLKNDDKSKSKMLGRALTPCKAKKVKSVKETFWEKRKNKKK